MSTVAGAPVPTIDYHLEAYKLLADMYKHEESVFWTRNQALLTLNSALAVILVGILTLQNKLGSPGTNVLPIGTQSISAPAGQPSAITIQQIVNQPTTPAAAPTSAVWVPLILICLVGGLLCVLWTVLIRRAQGINDHFINHMQYLERTYLKPIENMRKYDELFDPEDPSLSGLRRTFSLTGTKTVIFEPATPDLPKDKNESRLPWWGSRCRIFTTWTRLAQLFILVWIAIALWVSFNLR
jgi:hypothetical protein